MYRKAALVVAFLSVTAIAGYHLAAYGLSLLNYDSKLVEESPNKQLRVFLITSRNDGRGYAPYGEHLVLTHRRAISVPEEGYVVFAGYCKGAAGATWEGDAQLVVYCERTEPAPTEAVRAYGVSIKHVNGAAPSNTSLQARRP
ncbi:MAG: hypothetical protein REI94_18285 [Moraxellaceae bacterium]|nr:hypothetical protein [Moraxellaceae bacterium]